MTTDISTGSYPLIILICSLLCPLCIFPAFLILPEKVYDRPDYFSTVPQTNTFIVTVNVLVPKSLNLLNHNISWLPLCQISPNQTLLGNKLKFISPIFVVITWESLADLHRIIGFPPKPQWSKEFLESWDCSPRNDLTWCFTRVIQEVVFGFGIFFHPIESEMERIFVRVWGSALACAPVNLNVSQD